MPKVRSSSQARSDCWFLRCSLASAKAALALAMVCLALAPPSGLAQGLGLGPACNVQGEGFETLRSGEQCAPTTLDNPALGARSQWVTVVQFRFTGNTLFTSKVLAAVLADELNRPMSFGSLQALSEKVEGFYRAHGRLAIVVLPAQDISSNKITFVVVEAKPGKLHMEAGWDADAAVSRLS
jgi:hemolysin activation/secretion protein